jgi:lipopolysaccharide export LptBFGC system permease protein LptF
VEDTRVKRILTALFAMALLFSLSSAVVAQDAATDKKVAKAEKKEAKAASKNKALSLTGWVKTEGDKTVFVNDKDKQTWSVQNPDVLKAHDGMHVKVKATLNETDKSIMVDSVKDMRESKQAAEKKAKS